jgi:hypothetical protein
METQEVYTYEDIGDVAEELRYQFECYPETSFVCSDVPQKLLLQWLCVETKDIFSIRIANLQRTIDDSGFERSCFYSQESREAWANSFKDPPVTPETPTN